jgi:hypothetical protein
MKIIILLLLLLFTLSTFAQNSKKKQIDVNNINYVEILKVSTTKAPSKTKKLSKKLYIDFAQRWNDSKEIGANKYRMKYFVYLFLKNGEKRQFSVSGFRIQESGWMTYDIGDKQYFDTIWNAIK